MIKFYLFGSFINKHICKIYSWENSEQIGNLSDEKLKNIYINSKNIVQPFSKAVGTRISIINP